MSKRYAVIMNGLGGQGVLVAGEVLARSAARTFGNVMFSPSYDTARRGGFTECTVSFSDDDISSPWISRAETVIVFEPSKLASCEAKVKPGGMLIVESTGLKDAIKRTDIKMVTVPAIKTAIEMGNGQMANVVFLGAYAQIEKSISPEAIEEELRQTFASREKVARNSILAFKEGMRLARAATL